MNYDQFVQVIRDKVTVTVGDGFEVQVYTADKNNGTRYKGIIIRAEDASICPVIYLEGYYDRYLAGTASIEEVVTDVLRTYADNRDPGNYPVKDFLDFNYISNRVIFKIINKEKNRDLLKDVPHTVIDNLPDLVIVYMVNVGEFRGSVATIMIRNEHMKEWGVDTQKLYELAMENTPIIFPWTLSSINEVLKGFGMPEIDAEIPMNILSTEYRVNGAGVIVYPGVLHEVYKRMGGSYYILPSSIHEVIVVPKMEGRSEYLKEMVRTINASEVADEEVLSDSVYLYFENEEVGSQCLQAL